MARWMAIVALLLGVGFTAFESFTAPAVSGSTTIQSMEGGTPWPPPSSPQPSLMEGGTPWPPPDKLSE